MLQPTRPVTSRVRGRKSPLSRAGHRAAAAATTLPLIARLKRASLCVGVNHSCAFCMEFLVGEKLPNVGSRLQPHVNNSEINKLAIH